jgi:hypothetical protein
MATASYFHKTLLLMVAAFVAGLTGVCSAADDKHVIYSPLQLFKDFCTDAGWSLVDVSRLAQQQNLALISSEDVPVLDDSPAHKRIWEAKTVVGPVGVIVIDGKSKSHGHTVTCSVRAPPESANFIRSWCVSSLRRADRVERDGDSLDARI